MKHIVTILFIILFGLALSSCGKQCTDTKSPGDTVAFARLSDVKCPNGQYLEQITTTEWLNGDIKSYDGHCVKVERVCK